jgi:hypothetical protein
MAGGGGRRPHSPPAGQTAALLPVSAFKTPCYATLCCGALCHAATISARVLCGDGSYLVWSQNPELQLQEEVPWECREVRVMGRTVNQPRCASTPAAPHIIIGYPSSHMASHSAEGSLSRSMATSWYMNCSYRFPAEKTNLPTKLRWRRLIAYMADDPSLTYNHSSLSNLFARY